MSILPAQAKIPLLKPF